MKQLDMTKVLTGMALGKVLVVTIGAGAMVRGPSEKGRLQLCPATSGLYMIDTMSGQVWQQSQEGF